MTRYERNLLPSETQRAQRRDLAAGPLCVRFDPSGELRHLQVAGDEIVNRIYFALRDENWGTIPGVVSNCRVVADADGFSVEFDVSHDSSGIQFSWHGRIAGDANGVRFVAEGRAKSEFLYNRIGLCVLYPSHVYAGRGYTVRGEDGTEQTGTFPVAIEPQRLEEGHLVAAIRDICALNVDLPAGRIECEFKGDVFEIEDQRNWTDNSYKAYSTPIHLPYPRTAKPGDEFHQEVHIRARRAEGVHVEPVQAAAVRLDIGAALEGTLAAVGFEMPRPFAGLDAVQHRALEALRPHHLRYEVRPWEPEWNRGLEASLRTCVALTCEAEVAVHLIGDETRRIQELVGALRRARPRTRVVVLHVDEEVTDPRWVALARRETKALPWVVSVGGGTERYFCEVNRNREAATAGGAVDYSMSPQVHAFDEESIIETLPAQRETVTSARALVGDAPIGVAPVTLHQRTAARRRMREANAADEADLRQKSVFLAAWTIGSLYYLQDSGASTLTYFEVHGPRGLWDGGGPGSVSTHPVYSVFAAYRTLRSGEMLQVSPSHRHQAIGMAAKVGGGEHALVGNLTAEHRRIEVGPFVGSRLRVRVLADGNGWSRAMLLPARADGRAAFALGPYECAYVESDPVQTDSLDDRRAER